MEGKSIVYLTGFGSFHGVSQNPTQIFIESIQKKKKILVNRFFFLENI